MNDPDEPTRFELPAEDLAEIQEDAIQCPAAWERWRGAVPKAIDADGGLLCNPFYQDEPGA